MILTKVLLKCYILVLYQYFDVLKTNIQTVLCYNVQPNGIIK